MYSRAVCPRLRASLPSLPGTVMTRLSPSTTTSDPDTPSPLTRALMICCACASASRLGAEPSGVRAVSVTLVPPCRSMPSLGAVFVPGEKHQQIDADQHHQEHRQVTGRVHRRRRRCHVPCISSRISFLPPTEPTCRAGARRASGSSVPVGRLPVRNRWSPGARRPRRQHPCQGPR